MWSFFFFFFGNLGFAVFVFSSFRCMVSLSNWCLSNLLVEMNFPLNTALTLSHKL